MFIVARTAKGRPTLMHRVVGVESYTYCGLRVEGWSRAYFGAAIPQILCKKCGASS